MLYCHNSCWMIHPCHSRSTIEFAAFVNDLETYNPVTVSVRGSCTRTGIDHFLILLISCCSGRLSYNTSFKCIDCTNHRVWVFGSDSDFQTSTSASLVDVWRTIRDCCTASILRATDFITLLQIAVTTMWGRSIQATSSATFIIAIVVENQHSQWTHCCPVRSVLHLITASVFQTMFRTPMITALCVASILYENSCHDCRLHSRFHRRGPFHLLRHVYSSAVQLTSNSEESTRIWICPSNRSSLPSNGSETEQIQRTTQYKQQ